MTKSERTLVFAQAGQDFVDVLISFLTFPLGGVLCKLNFNSSMGSMDALYKGILDLNEDIYLISRNAKNKLLNPKVARELNFTNQILPFDESLPSVVPKSAMGPCGGFLKGPSIYMVKNDLNFTRITPVSSAELFRSLQIPFDDLEEKVVTVGIKECINILKASLTSRDALTDGLAGEIQWIRDFGDVKKMLPHKTGLEPEHRRLFKGKEKENEDHLHTEGVKDKSKLLLLEDAASKERKLEEDRKHNEMSKASEAVSVVRAEVDKLSGKVSALEVAVDGGTKVSDKEFVVSTELLMMQLLKLDGIEAEGEAMLQRKAEVRRVQKIVDTLDSLKARNKKLQPF